jgi:hypothetical protein
MNQSQMPQPKSPILRPWLLIVLILVIIGAAAYWWFAIRNVAAPEATVTPSTSPTTSPKITVSPSAASSLTYTNSAYGFTLTFPATWKGYKLKEKVFTGSVITYYINIPTTDSSAVASDESDAGYYSPFAITVYTLAQWGALQAEEGPKDTLITQNDTYAFGWSQANGIPASDFGTKSNDIKTIIASFKLK